MTACAMNASHRLCSQWVRMSMSEPLTKVPAPYDGSEAHKALLDAVRGEGTWSGDGGPTRPDVYQYLMGQEKRVLDTVDRVVNDAKRTDALRQPSFLDAPLHELGMRMLSALRGLFDDLLAARTFTDVSAALSEGQRRTYLGACLLALAFCLALVQASS